MTRSSRAVLTATGGGVGPEILIPRPYSSTDRDHSNAQSIARHHTLTEERALIITGRNSGTSQHIHCRTRTGAVHDPKPNEALSLESLSAKSSSVEALPAAVRPRKLPPVPPWKPPALKPPLPEPLPPAPLPWAETGLRRL